MPGGDKEPVPGWEPARSAGGLTPGQHADLTLEDTETLGWPSTTSSYAFPQVPSRSSLLYRAEPDTIVALEVRPAGNAPLLDAPIDGSSSPASPESASPTVLVSTARQGTVLLLDLLAARVTQLSAADDCLLACLRGLLGETLAGRWSSPCEVLAVAREPLVAFGELCGKAHFLALSSLEEALEEISTRFASTDLHIAPTLVVLAEQVSAQDLERAAATLARHRAVALVMLQAHRRARAVICLHADGQSEVYLRAEQLQVPERRFGAGAIGASSGDQSLLAPQPGSATVTQVEINILGPIEINGTTSPAQHRPKISELLVYLAMHPEGSLSRAWTAALWPDRRVPPQTVANRLSEARRLLGFASDGRPRLRRKGEHHQLVEISTDWQRFQELGRQSSSPQSWREALQLVRGRPFVDLQQDQWTILEGLAIEIEQAIADCALRVGAEAISRDDPELAAWAANCALRANPFDERLHRLLMRAADASGNRAGVEESLRNLALVLEIEGDPLSGVHPQTAALYQQLLRT